MDNNIKPEEIKSLNFLEEIIEHDLKTGKHKSILTRFPPEPNGYLHIGHAKAIYINFGLAIKYGGKTNLRFDDTNPVKEDVEYVDAIKEDVKWLGYTWAQELYASDYFEQLYTWAQDLIKKELAYVDDQTPDEIRKTRGTVTEAGINGPYRNRSVSENLELFARMRAGEFKDGDCVLRAKIDMAHPNMLMRDPLMYRIIHAEHHRTGNKWCIYPMYDYAHGESDSYERITHSMCSLEFDIHRPLYEWFIKKLEIFPSRQIEFARLNLTYTVMSKRKLLELVTNKIVNGWDDPRMPTISALRRRGYTPSSIRNFVEKAGITRRPNIIDLSLLELCIREDLNKIADRRMAVINPVKLVITNYPEGEIEEVEAVNNPEDENSGTRTLTFGRELYIERDDFMLDPPKKYFRLAPGQEVRLKYAYFIKCENVITNTAGEVTEIHCTYDPLTKSGSGSLRKVKGTIHWLYAKNAQKAEVRLYDRLFTEPDMENKSYEEFLNPDSLKVIEAFIEPALKNIKDAQSVQFERLGYFCKDKDSTENKLIFNRTVTLRDSWAKINKE